jgi:hypothetical protein
MRDDGTLYSGYRGKREEPIIVKAKFDCAECDVHETPLVSREDFFAVQRILDASGKNWIQHKASWESDESPFLGQGVLACTCGMKLYTKPNKRKHRLTYYYRCSSYNNKHTPCGAPHLHQEDIDAKLQTWTSLMLTNRRYLKSLTLIDPTINLDGIQRQIDELETVKTKQYAKIGRMKDEALLLRLIAETESQIENLQKELKAVPVKTEFDLEALVKRFVNFGKLALAEQKKIFRETFRRITIDYDGHIREIEFRDGRKLPFVPIDEIEMARVRLR